MFCCTLGYNQYTEVSLTPMTYFKSDSLNFKSLGKFLQLVYKFGEHFYVKNYIFNNKCCL